MTDLRAEKAALRQTILARRDGLPVTLRADLGRHITAELLQQPSLAAARVILAYLSFGSEFDTSSFVDAIRAAGKRLVLPRVNREAGRLDLYFVADPDLDTIPGVWGIRQPAPDRCPSAALGEIDFVLAPGVAFSLCCDRLGYGGGYYDKLLSRQPDTPTVVAAAFEVQMAPALPVGLGDVPVDLVITEMVCYRRGG